MTDLQLFWDNENWRADWRLTSDGLLADGDDLGTAVMLSLFTDRTAQPDDVTPDDGPCRGWWADAWREYPLGSRLWLLWRETKTEITRRRAEEYSREALEWMVTAGVARRVEVDAHWLPHPDATGALEIDVTVYPPAGARRLWRFAYSWAQRGGIA